MKTVKPDAIVQTFPAKLEGLILDLERYGRTCYKSEDRITDGSAEKFIKMVIDKGHETVIEHHSITVKFICDRAVANAIVRHRLASYSQESTHYINYSNGKYGRDITFIPPYYTFNWDASLITTWATACKAAEWAYFGLIEDGAKHYEARIVLPLCLKTELVMTANLREWRHFFNLRARKNEQPQTAQLAYILREKFRKLVPIIFDDCGDEEQEELLSIYNKGTGHAEYID